MHRRLKIELSIAIAAIIAFGLFAALGYSVRTDAPSSPAAASASHVSQTTADRPTAPTPPSQVVRDKLLVWKTETDPLRRSQLHAELLALLTDANVAEIVRNLTPELLDTPFGEIALKRWADGDHLAAAAWLSRLPGGPSELQTGLVTYGWLEKDRAQLHAYVDGLPPGSWRNQVLTCATNDALLLKDGSEAIGLLQRLPPAAQRDEMLGWASTQWAMHEPAQAAAWVGEVSDPALQTKLFGAVAIGYAWSDPTKAAELLLSSGTATGDNLATVASVFNIWGTKAPAQAAEWAATHLDGDARRQAIRCAVTAWGYQDMSAVQKWIETLPPGEARTQAERTAVKITAAHEGREIGDE